MPRTARPTSTYPYCRASTIRSTHRTSDPYMSKNGLPLSTPPSTAPHSTAQHMRNRNLVENHMASPTNCNAWKLFKRSDPQWSKKPTLPIHKSPNRRQRTTLCRAAKASNNSCTTSTPWLLMAHSCSEFCPTILTATTVTNSRRRPESRARTSACGGVGEGSGPTKRPLTRAAATRASACPRAGVEVPGCGGCFLSSSAAAAVAVVRLRAEKTPPSSSSAPEAEAALASSLPSPSLASSAIDADGGDGVDGESTDDGHCFVVGSGGNGQCA